MSELFDLIDCDHSLGEISYLQHLKDRTIIFNQEVTENIATKIIIPLLDFEKDDSQAPVTLYLQTVGGSVADGMVLCNIIDNYKKPLNIIVLGYSLSMGTIILCSGNHNPNVTKYCYPFSYALHHSGNLSLFGEGNIVQDNYEFVKATDNRINEYIVSNTGITMQELRDNSRKQWFLTSQQMKEKHLVDHIIGEDA